MSYVQPAPDADQQQWRPQGPPDDGQCMAEDDDGQQLCTVRPGWRLTVANRVENWYGYDGRYAKPAGRIITATFTDPSWLVCTPHLRDALVLTDDSYGQPIVVEVWHG